ncbi:MAG: tRNA threonylcarbamoyladenosine dehydratase [Bacteroidaceae bacterium]|nr:tRNA threonylcarbamoyladenosine dehydratase [Bacteroidaceae bacterium]
MQTNQSEAIYNRTTLLVGDTAMTAIQAARVILFGVGGVGSWCAESLVRSGIGRLTLVDSDCVAPSNLNRQLMATTETLGQPKVDALKSRLLSINPKADIEVRHELYTAASATHFQLDQYDYVVDAIDSLASKADLILRASSLPPGTTLFSSMGAALKMDPTAIRVAEFWKAEGCPLARALRTRFRRDKTFPKRKFKVVYSPELLPNLGRRLDEAPTASSQLKGLPNGTVAHITAIFGFTLAGLVIQDICQRMSGRD